MADFNAMFMHPLTQFGGMLMAGSDPSRQGLGGFGGAIMGMGEHIRAQQEQARLEQIQDIQNRLLQARLDAQAREEAIRGRAEAWAQGQGEAAQVDPVSAWQMAQEAQYSEPKISNAMRVFEEGGGEAGWGMPFEQFYQSQYKGGGITVEAPIPPAPRVAEGYYPQWDKENKKYVVKRMPDYVPEKVQLRRNLGNLALSAMDRLDQLYDEYGTEPAPGGGRGVMETAQLRAKFAMQQFMEMGQLQTHEEKMLDRMIGDATELLAAGKGVDAYRAKLGEVRRFIADKMEIEEGSRTGATQTGKTDFGDGFSIDFSKAK